MKAFLNDHKNKIEKPNPHMKKLFPIICILLLAGCTIQAEKKVETSNSNFNVELFFERNLE